MSNWILIFILGLMVSPWVLSEEASTMPDSSGVKHRATWYYGVDMGVTGSFGFNRNLAGGADGNGNYFGLGGKLNLEANYLSKRHEWKNSLSLLETFNKIPSIRGLIKSADQLVFDTVYCANWGERWGIFAHIKLNTSIFPSGDRREQDVRYDIEDIKKNKMSVTGRYLELTKPFQPLYLQESTGLFVKLLNFPYLAWRAYAGPAARQNFADHQRVVVESKNAAVSVRVLSTTYHFGPMLGTTISGLFLHEMFRYEAGANALYALFRLPMDSSLTFSQKLNVEFFGTLSFNFLDWLALAWDFRAIRIPDILEEFQVHNSVLLTFSYKH